MINDQTKDNLKRRLPEYVGMITRPDNGAGKDKYVCPCCHSGANGGRNSDGAFTLYPESNSFYCFSCGKGGDIFDLVRETQGIENFSEQAKYLAGIFGEKIDPPQGRPEAAPLPPARKENSPGKYQDFIEKAAASADAVRDYLHGRGINDDIIDCFMLGYNPRQYFPKAKAEMPALIFNYNDDFSYYSARSLDGKYFAKPKSDDAGDEPLYNPAALYGAKPCFICEGALDALSIIQSGGNAAALIGTAWENKLIPQIQKQRPTVPLVLCLDNDEPGRASQAKLAEKLGELDVQYINASFEYDKYDGDKKDANDLLRSNADQLHWDVRHNKETALRPDSMAEYMEKQMLSDIEALRLDAGRKTGFSNLDDAAGSLYSGLYVLGGISSVGKTTFAHAMADNLAEAGEHVIYFSLEQSRLEMASKSISRRTAILDSEHAVTSLQIRLGASVPLVGQAKLYYSKAIGGNLSVIEGNFNCTVPFIEKYTEDYMRRNDTRPVIFIDYLQIIGATADPDTGRKPTDPRQIVDANMTALKRLSRRLSVPVIVVSSLNRENYLAPLSFESFKESGCIEYTADVIWGLQLTAIHGDTIADPKESKTRKRAIMQAAKNTYPKPREVELVCLKNRYGRDYNCIFKYYPQFDYFIPSK